LPVVSNVADSPQPARLLRWGVLSGGLAGLVAGCVWYLVVIGTTSLQAYLVPLIGVCVAYGVFAGMREPGTPAAILAVALTLITLLFAMFYVERHLVVTYFHQNDDVRHIPLVPYLDWVASLVRHAYRKAPSLGFYSVLALVAAGWFGHQGFDTHDPLRRRS
jgi:hypothetical protein